MPITLRLAEVRDLPAMAAIRAADSHDGAFWADRITRYQRGEHSPQQALPQRVLFVAVEEEKVVGFAAAHRTLRFGCDGELQWINVAAQRRGHGIAGQLLAEIWQWFIAQNARRICVNVYPANTAAASTPNTGHSPGTNTG